MRNFREVDPSERVEGEHLFCIGMMYQSRPWAVCRWCQQFKEDVEDKPCKGFMKIDLN
jgi:hypothetical protein